MGPHSPNPCVPTVQAPPVQKAPGLTLPRELRPCVLVLLRWLLPPTLTDCVLYMGPLTVALAALWEGEDSRACAQSTPPASLHSFSNPLRTGPRPPQPPRLPKPGSLRPESADPAPAAVSTPPGTEPLSATTRSEPPTPGHRECRTSHLLPHGHRSARPRSPNSRHTTPPEYHPRHRRGSGCRGQVTQPPPHGKHHPLPKSLPLRQLKPWNMDKDFHPTLKRSRRKSNGSRVQQ